MNGDVISSSLEPHTGVSPVSTGICVVKVILSFVCIVNVYGCQNHKNVIKKHTTKSLIRRTLTLYRWITHQYLPKTSLCFNYRPCKIFLHTMIIIIITIITIIHIYIALFFEITKRYVTHIYEINDCKLKKKKKYHGLPW